MIIFRRKDNIMYARVIEIDNENFDAIETDIENTLNVDCINYFRAQKKNLAGNIIFGKMKI